MPATHSVTHLVALAVLAAGLVGCGEGVRYYQGAGPPAHTRSYATEAASPLPAGVDTMTGLQQRPMRPPSLASNQTCTASAMADLGSVAPNYGADVGPAHLSGQDTWYSGGQVAILMVEPRYSGPLLVRAFQLGGKAKSTVTLADMQSPNNGFVDKEEQHGVTVIPALHTAGGGVYLSAAIPTSSWRAWFGWLSTAGPGCFGLQVDGDEFTEFIVFEVNPGTPPPD